jgi:endonuclease-3
MKDLLTLSGVGRKIANLLLGDLYKKPALVADTHCIRICGRLGFYSEDMKDPVKTEKIMSELISPEEQSDFCHRIVQFGRDVCIARSPRCEECTLADVCKGKRK